MTMLTLASVHTAIAGWDIVCALLVLLVAIILERVIVPTLPWVAWVTCFGVFMFGFAICVNW